MDKIIVSKHKHMSKEYPIMKPLSQDETKELLALKFIRWHKGTENIPCKCRGSPHALAVGGYHEAVYFEKRFSSLSQGSVFIMSSFVSQPRLAMLTP